MSRETLRQLSKLDLKKRPETKIKSLIQSLDNFGFVTKMLRPGDSIIRARPNYNGEIFQSISDYSYKPSKYNTEYARASTPNQTMFYGCLLNSIHDSDRKKGLTARHIAALETFEWLRSRTTKCFQIVSFGRWEIKEPIRIGVIVQKKHYYNKTEYTSEIVDQFNQFSLDHPDLVEHTVEVLDFFAKQFKRYDVNSKHAYKYMISAIFSELVVKKGLEGIMYPSVRIGGKGFNVAIKPESVDKKMILTAAGECHIYKKKRLAFANNITSAVITDQISRFNLVPITDSKLRVSEEICLAQIKAKHKKELNNCKEFDPESNKLKSLYERILQMIYGYDGY